MGVKYTGLRARIMVGWSCLVCVFESGEDEIGLLFTCAWVGGQVR